MSICVRHLPYCRCCKSWFSVTFSICPIVDAASHYFLLHFPRSRRKLRSWGWGLPRPGLSWLGAPGYSDCWGYLDWGSQTRGTQTGGTQTKETHTRVCPDQGYPDQGYPDGGTLTEGTQMGNSKSINPWFKLLLHMNIHYRRSWTKAQSLVLFS